MNNSAFLRCRLFLNVLKFNVQPELIVICLENRLKTEQLLLCLRYCTYCLKHVEYNDS